jgi:hypothetical protein
VLSAVGALAVAAALVWQSAYAGFADQTTPLSADVSTGTVVLTNNTAGLGQVSFGMLKPGYSRTSCLVVTSTGSVPAQVRLYRTAISATNEMASYITIDATSGTGGGVNGDCAGFTSNGNYASYSPMTSFPTGYGGGVLRWNTAGNTAGESRTYRITFTVSSSAPTSTKGGSATVAFVWEAQNQ